jgi:hypothetical protein
MLLSMKMEVQSMFSERNNVLLIVEGAKFRRGRTLQCGKTHWTCSNKNCNAKLYTITDKNKIIESNLSHNHEVNTSTLSWQIVSNGCKRKAKEDIN